MSDRIAVMSNGNLMQVGTPEEIYERPATAEVAAFIGKSNFIDGTITSSPPAERQSRRWRIATWCSRPLSAPISPTATR